MLNMHSHRILVFFINLILISRSARAEVIGFDISLSTSSLTASQLEVFEAAATTWESLIRGYKGDVNLSKTTTTLSIQVNTGSLAADEYGYATINSSYYKPTTSFDYLYAHSGNITVNSSRISALEAGTLSATLYDVALHEIAHVMGFGLLWSGNARAKPGYQELYVAGSGQYTGAEALAAYQAEFDPTATFVPVETDGGVGTANYHWDENNGGGATGLVSSYNGLDKQFELGTGWIESNLFISQTTLASFRDIGYLTVSNPEPGHGIALIVLTVAGGACRLHRRQSRKQGRDNTAAHVDS